MNTHLISQDNFFLIASSDIDRICQPLKRLGITYFTYIKNFLDGSQVYLSNSAQWIEDYYNLGLYKSSSFENNLHTFRPGYFIWPKEDKSPVYTHGRDKFDSDNGITLIQASDKSVEFFFFSGSVKSRWLNNFYLNNIDLLEKFIIYFKDSAARIIRKAEKNRIILPRPALANTFENNLYAYDTLKLRSEFLRDINLEEPTNLESSSISISDREREVAFNILQGKTAIETAEKLIISRKTVERHIENMKRKLQCANKAELIKRLLVLEKIPYKI